jgi:CRP-like cAMP-binding protein
MTLSTLDQNPIFNGFTLEELDLLRPLFIPCEYHPGTVLFEQGDPAEFFYIVTSGEIAIQYKPEDGKPILIARIKPGGIVGWSAVIGRSHYTSAAFCTSFARLLRIGGSELQVLGESHQATCDKFVDRLAEAVAERAQGSNPSFLELLGFELHNGTH